MFTSFDQVTNRFEPGKVDIILEEPHWEPSDAEGIVPNTFLDKDPTIINEEETVNTYVFLEVTVPYDDDPNLIIEKTYQDNANPDNTNLSGAVDYKNTSGAKIPYYKFIATDQEVSTEEYNSENRIKQYYTTDAELYSATQKVNQGWLLLDGYPTEDTSRKTFTYVYAYVFDDNTLKPLIANGRIDIPLFNKIYLLNFREREKSNEVSTAFPDPGRDYSIKIKAYGIQSNFLKSDNQTTTDPAEVWNMLKPVE